MKIVCDFELIRAQLTIIEKQIQAMDKAISTYQSDIATTLTSWKGVAKDAFTLTNDDQIATANTHVSDLTEIVKFVKDAVSKIEGAEGEIAGLRI